MLKTILIIWKKVLQILSPDWVQIQVLNLGSGFVQIASQAKSQEDRGYDGIWTAETSHDPFLPLAIAAEHTEKLEIGKNFLEKLPRSTKKSYKG